MATDGEFPRLQLLGEAKLVCRYKLRGCGAEGLKAICGRTVLARDGHAGQHRRAWRLAPSRRPDAAPIVPRRCRRRGAGAGDVEGRRRALSAAVRDLPAELPSARGWRQHSHPAPAVQPLARGQPQPRRVHLGAQPARRFALLRALPRRPHLLGDDGRDGAGRDAAVRAAGMVAVAPWARLRRRAGARARGGDGADRRGDHHRALRRGALPHVVPSDDAALGDRVDAHLRARHEHVVDLESGVVEPRPRPAHVGDRAPSPSGALVLAGWSPRLRRRRSQTAILAAVVFLFLAVRHRSRVLYFAGLPALLGVALLAYNYAIFSTALGGYGSFAHFNGSLPVGVAGLLVSPNRGLLVFTPIMAFALWGAVRVWRVAAPPWLRWLSVALLLHVLVYALFKEWWAGYTYGPRYFSDVLPALILFLVYGLVPTAGGRRWAVAVGLALRRRRAGIGVYAADDAWNREPTPSSAPRGLGLARLRSCAVGKRLPSPGCGACSPTGSSTWWWRTWDRSIRRSSTGRSGAGRSGTMAPAARAVQLRITTAATSPACLQRRGHDQRPLSHLPVGALVRRWRGRAGYLRRDPAARECCTRRTGADGVRSPGAVTAGGLRSRDAGDAGDRQAERHRRCRRPAPERPRQMRRGSARSRQDLISSRQAANTDSAWPAGSSMLPAPPANSRNV